ncbi:hypothetical protein J0H58_11710 [bacterium]|nr:hypothetical protein [bacterium]
MDSAPTAVSCRLAVLLARAAPVAVVLRRGPARWVQLVRWRTDTDAFEPGQWFHGRVYDRRCDLSPDGSLLIYFASKFTGRTLADRAYTYAWTAVSRPPYFTALALWPKGDCWHGGGLFPGPTRIWLNHHPAVAAPHPRHRPQGLTVEPNPEAWGEDRPVWFRRMARDGWNLIEEGVFSMAGGEWRTDRREVWERPSPAGPAVLRRSTDAISFRYPGGPYLESFRVMTDAGEVPVPGASWADWDQAGRLVFARDGQLLTAAVEGGRLAERELIDLNPATPTRVEAPEWARRW